MFSPVVVDMALRYRIVVLYAATTFLFTLFLFRADATKEKNVPELTRKHALHARFIVIVVITDANRDVVEIISHLRVVSLSAFRCDAFITQRDSPKFASQVQFISCFSFCDLPSFDRSRGSPFGCRHRAAATIHHGKHE